MKKALIAITILSLFIGSTNLSSQALTTKNKEQGTISVNTSAETEIAPDTAEISFTVVTYDSKSIQNATVENKNISKAVLVDLNSLIDITKGDYIKTTDFKATPLYTYTNSKKIFDKYEVSNKVIVHTKSIDNIGKMIDNSTKLGVTNVDSLNFSVSNYESECNNLISKATKKALSRADAIAKALNTSTDGLSNINSSCNTNNQNTPRYYMAKNMISDLAESTSLGETSTSISNGVIKINANVNATFFVK